MSEIKTFAELEGSFPKKYEHFLLSKGRRWSKKKFELSRIETLTRGDFVSIPVEKMQLVSEWISDNRPLEP
jgi:hypothetical protein